MTLTEQEQKQFNKLMNATIKRINEYKKLKRPNGDYDVFTGINLCWDLWNYEGDIKILIENFRENHKEV